MPGRRRLATLALALPGMFVAAPAADAADHVISGRTDQGRHVRVTVTEDGRLRGIRIGWRGHCRAPDARFHTITGFGVPPVHQRDKRSVITGPYSFKEGSLRIRVRPRLHAVRHSPRKWSGSFRGIAVIRRRNGRVIDSCRSGLVHWRAARVDR